MGIAKPRKVFISYVWKSDEYKEKILAFAEKLLGDGVDVILDQWAFVGDDMLVFMEQGIREADKVLIMCEAEYAKRANDRAGGVGYETRIITYDIYEKYDRRKFIPIFMEEPRVAPDYLKTYLGVDLSSGDELAYRDLFFAIHDMNRKKKPPRSENYPDWFTADNPEKYIQGQDASLHKARETEKDGRPVKPELGKTPEWMVTELDTSGGKRKDDAGGIVGGIMRQDASGKRVVGRRDALREANVIRAQVTLQKQRLSLKEGDRNVPFGRFPYGEDGRKEDLLWRVLKIDAEKRRALLITENLIDCRPYQAIYEHVTWEGSDLKDWMNGEFIREAFSESDKSGIALVVNLNPDNQRYGTKGGNETNDRVFALSINEANAYFNDAQDRMAAPTPYAKMKGSYSEDDYKLPNGEPTGWWWLRSPGLSSHDAANVGYDGIVRGDGGSVRGSGVSVRPALWLNL